MIRSRPELARTRNHIGVVNALFDFLHFKLSIVALNITFQGNKNLSSSGKNLIL